MKSELGAERYVLPALFFLAGGYLENHYSQVTILLTTFVIPIYIPLRWAGIIRCSRL
jgi:uncharacterized membrane protein